MNERDEQTIRDTIRESADAAFAPGFEDRVIARLRARPARADAVVFDLTRYFKRLAPLAAAAAAIIAVTNLRGGDGSTVDRLLGRSVPTQPTPTPTMTLDELYGLSSLAP
jgi:hypothetical protein